MAEFNSADELIDFIDFNNLREQKEALIEILSAVTGANMDSKAQKAQGIVNLIDHIQDYAVDVLGKDENEVFNLKEEG